MHVRHADPYRDTDVIDSRAPRFNQVVIGTLSVVAVVTGLWPILALLALQLAVGLTFGRRYCIPCVVYFELIQPRIGEGPIEDARPPRFANQVGLVVLGAASVAYASGLGLLGAVLGVLVAALALLAASTGLCVGCEIYKLGARLRGIRSHRLERIDLGDLDARGHPLHGDLVVEFLHPLCTECHQLRGRLEREGRRVVTIDVSKQPELARKYGVQVVPTAVAVSREGRVIARVAG